MAPQERSRELCLARLGGMLAMRKINVPIGANQMGNLFGQPFPLLRQEPEIENPDRRISALRQDREHGVAQQGKVSGIRPTADQEPDRRRHRSSSGYRAI